MVMRLVMLTLKKNGVKKRVERGEKMAEVARSYLINRFIIGTIFNNEDNIM